MFCCLDFGGDSSYPGQRKFQTGGNALSSPPPTDYPMNPTETVCVTVPHGKAGGDHIIVSAPSGKCVTAVIPHGMRPGGQFKVDIPTDPYNNGNNPNSIGNSSGYGQGQENKNFNPPPPTAPQIESFQDYPVATEVVEPVPAKMIPESRQDTYDANIAAVPSSSPLTTTSSPATTTSTSSTYPTNNSKKKLLLVKVPPGVLPGTELHVQIPGENRKVSAKVPPGVSEFQVAYEPQQHPQHQPIQVMGTLIQSQAPNYSTSTSPVYGTNTSRPYQHSNYNTGNMNRPYNNYQGNTYTNTYSDGYYGGGGGNYGYNCPHGNNYQNHNNHYNRNNDGGVGIGPAIAGALAGAGLIGAAGYMVHHHNQNDGDDVDYGGGGDDFGGGDDYGGGDDFGGDY